MGFINFIVFTFLFTTVQVFADTTEANITCCDTGEVLLRRNLCWEPKSNKTSPLLMKCKKTFRYYNPYTINEKLELNLQFGDDVHTFSKGVYCVSNTTTIRDVTLSNTTSVSLLCADIEEQIINADVLGYCLILSILFLIPTAIIYTALHELRDVQGKSIINFCTSLAIGQGIIVIMRFVPFSDMKLCAVRGFLAYFFMIAAFFWTNAIAIQVLLNTRRPSTLDYSWHEFKWYFLYAWGTPVLLTIVMAIVNFYPGTHARPGIGLNHCWFYDTTQQWYYMYSVMTILLAANIAIFIYISIVLWRLTFSSTHLRALKYKFMMTVRLIILLGIPWVFEMIGSLVGQHIIISIIDIFNCLQGLLIFLLLVIFRRRVIKLMYKHGWLDCISTFVEKHLAMEDDEENVVQHTDVPMTSTDRAEGQNVL